MEPLRRKERGEFANQKENFDGICDPVAKYSDAFYEDFINRFQVALPKRKGYRCIKRCFDILLAASLLVLLSPLMYLLAVAIHCDSAGPVIFRQERIGLNGKSFQCYKFRSMRMDAPKNCPTSMLEHAEDYQTRVGKVLRRLSLDELPQLWCLLVGTMSFIGYRPLVLTEEKCNEMRGKLGVFSMRPGISGYAQVRGRDDVYYKNKAIMDAYYVKHASVLLDLKLLMQTVVVVLTRRGNKDARDKKKVKSDSFNDLSASFK